MAVQRDEKMALACEGKMIFLRKLLFTVHRTGR